MNTLIKTSAALALIAGLAACASTPAPVEVAEAPTPPPAVETVTPPPATNSANDRAAPAVTAPRTYAGPNAGSLEDFRVNVGERVYYDLAAYRLDADDRTILERQAAWLQSYPDVRILVAGNCDERGTREYNLALGERRAAVVKDYLVSLGVDPSRIDTVSYGKERPLDGASNEAAWAKNRNGFTQIVSGAANT